MKKSRRRWLCRRRASEEWSRCAATRSDCLDGTGAPDGCTTLDLRRDASAGLAPAASPSGAVPEQTFSEPLTPKRDCGMKPSATAERGANKYRRDRLRSARADDDDAPGHRRAGGACHEWIGTLPPEDAGQYRRHRRRQTTVPEVRQIVNGRSGLAHRPRALPHGPRVDETPNGLRRRRRCRRACRPPRPARRAARATPAAAGGRI